MAHTAVDKKQDKYGVFNYMIRAKLFKGLKTGTMNFRGQFLSLMIIRRHINLIFNYCNEDGLLDKKIEGSKNIELPFRIDSLPIKIPSPNELILNMETNGNVL